MYKIKLMPEAEAHIKFWAQSGQIKTLSKIQMLLIELEEHPRTGTGQVEQLKDNLRGFWSRRINKSSRLVYSIDDETIMVTVISAKGHYDNL